MGLLRDAAAAWEALHDTSYVLLVGNRKRWVQRITLRFFSENFYHLAGFHYATDVDFGVRLSELRKPSAVRSFADGTISDAPMEKSIKWDDIRPRLNSIVHLEQGLDDDFLIYQYLQNHVKGGTSIPGQFLIKSPSTGIVFFVFLDRDTDIYYCRSIFEQGFQDYSEGQPRLNLLQKTKIVGQREEYTWKHPRYNPDLGIPER